jgi:hypothetical protein
MVGWNAWPARVFSVTIVCVLSDKRFTRIMGIFKILGWKPHPLPPVMRFSKFLSGTVAASRR